MLFLKKSNLTRASAKGPKYPSVLDLTGVTLMFGTNFEILKVCPVYA